MAIPSATISPRILLANHFCGEGRIPETTIRSLFDGIIKDYDVDCILKERIWSIVKTDKVKLLKALLAQEFCYRVLNHFTDNEINKMLQDLRTRSSIDPILCGKLMVLFSFNQQGICDKIDSEALKNREDLGIDVMIALDNEGIDY